MSATITQNSFNNLSAKTAIVLDTINNLKSKKIAILESLLERAKAGEQVDMSETLIFVDKQIAYFENIISNKFL
jgi:hypothetical protein